MSHLARDKRRAAAVAWSRATLPGAEAGALYATITGGDAADRLLSAESAAAKVVDADGKEVKIEDLVGKKVTVSTDKHTKKGEEVKADKA